MAAGTYERKEFVGGAPATSLAGALSDAATSCVLAAVTGWPDADPYPFVAVIDRGTANEEKILVRARTGTTLVTIVRGYDDTVGVAHSDGASVEHGLDASTIDQANRMANLLLAKGGVIASNGTNPVAVAPADMDGSEDGFVLQVNSATATGLEFGRPIHLVSDTDTPDLDGVPRIWFDETTGLLRASDGSTWNIPSSFPFFASAGARTTYYGGDPRAGSASIIAVGAAAYVEIYDGTSWIGLARRDEGIPRVADVAARDALFPAPIDGQHVYVLSSHAMQEYREDEWINVHNKTTVDDVQPVGPLAGDIWLQPIS